MLQRIVRTVCTVALGYSLALLPAVGGADDEKSAKPTKEPAPKAPDWSAYRTVGDVVGEVVKADDKQITLRVTWYQPQGGSGNNRRPPLSANNRNFRNPYASNRGRPSQGRAQMKEQHHDYVLEFVPESLVRTKKLPPKFDDNGKRAEHTQKDIDELRSPPGVTGYAANPYDLTPGTIVEIILIRDKSVAAAKATEDDLRVKYAIILGKNPTPPKGADKDDKKGKKKN